MIERLERRAQLGPAARVGLGADRRGLGVFGPRVHQVVVAGDRVLEQLDDELALVAEHRVDGLDGDAGLFGDRADAGGDRSRC